MKLLKGILWILLFTSCSHQNTYKETETYLQEEIKNRMLVLENDTAIGVSVREEAISLDKEVGNILLLSKDIENIGVSVKRGNAYFKSLSSKHGVNPSDFTTLRTDMHLDEISLILKQNELHLLNQLLFRSGKTNLPLYTAH